MSTSMRLLARGLVIDAQGGKSGVVNLVVRADKKHKGMFGRFRQHLANTLFSAGDFCHPSQNDRAVRVISSHVGATAGNDGLPNWADANSAEVYPLHGANGDAYYIAFLAHEGVKRHHDGRPIVGQSLDGSGQKSADDFQAVSPFVSNKVIVLQDPEVAT